MLVNYQEPNGQRSPIDDDWRRMTRRPQKIDEQRHRRRRCYGTQRNITPVGHAKKKEQEGADGCKWAEGKKHSKRCGHSFTAFEFKPDRETVSEQHRKTANHHPRGAFVGHAACKPDGCCAFRGVEDQRENSRQRARDTRDVGCADVTAAGFAHVPTAKQFCEEQSERNRAKKVRGEGIARRVAEIHTENMRRQASTAANGKLSTVVYSAPEGFSLLSIS